MNEAIAEMGMSDSGQNVREWRREVNRKKQNMGKRNMA
jgi:hypothetical protein